ncbi:Holliday junction branch migration protein RuvA [candidate division KSB1 bacterium]|nr:Holliday junction branch migration protein RuvA [candidate division KSB1 bacterium]
MIAFLKGRIVQKSTSEAVIEVNGVGFWVHIPASTFELLPDIDQECILYTHLHVREDNMQLYGFATNAERMLFLDLLSVSGIGPRLAIGILSAAPVNRIYGYICDKNEAALTRLPGLGRKTAQRLLLDLKDKASKVASGISTDSAIREEAVVALTSLGFTAADAQSAVEIALKEHTEGLSLEELIRTSLKNKKSL